jgi:hypothetical protein
MPVDDLIDVPATPEAGPIATVRVPYTLEQDEDGVWMAELATEPLPLESLKEHGPFGRLFLRTLAMLPGRVPSFGVLPGLGPQV